MIQKASGQKNEDVMKVRRCAVDRKGGRVAVTEHLLKLLLNFAVCLRVGTQQM